MNFATVKQTSRSSNSRPVVPFVIRRATILLCLAMVWLANDAAQAQIDWNNNTGSPNPFFSASSNWTGGVVPGAGDTARFNISGTYDVWWNTFTPVVVPEIDDLDIFDGDVTFLNLDATPQHELQTGGFSIIGNGTALTLRGVHLNSGSDNATIREDASLTIDGSHSAGSKLTVGSSFFRVAGELNVEAGGQLETGDTIVTKEIIGATPPVATVTGADSVWNNSGILSVGRFSDATLNVTAGGVVNSSHGVLGDLSSSDGVATINGGGSQWNVTNALTVGNTGDGDLTIEAGGAVDSSESTLGLLDGSEGVATITGAGSHWNNSNILTVGNSGDGFLTVADGGMVQTADAVLGRGDTGRGFTTVTGSGSQLNIDSELRVGSENVGTLDIAAEGEVNSLDARLGYEVGSSGTVNVDGAGTTWNNSSVMVVGRGGSGDVSITSGGVVNGNHSIIGFSSTATGNVTVDGSGSQWNHTGTLNVGSAGTANLDITNNGLVSVGVETTIGANGTVNLSGGRFEFGETTLESFSRVNANSGSMAGNVNHGDYTDIASLTVLSNAAVDLSEVAVFNTGTLFGNGSVDSGLNNAVDGEINTVAGERMRFAGAKNLNSGEINNFGGQVRFESAVINDETGFISGRGQFIANGGWENSGVMAFSAGTTDVLGDVVNEAGGQIVTSGGATTTFFDDVQHNGTEIRTSADAATVIFGLASGAGDYTGTGTVFFEGDLRPGNSPGIVDFEGDVVLGSGAESFIELAGLGLGDFDQLDIAGSLDLAGDLSVSLYGGFELGFNQQFLIADVDGDLTGTYFGLGEGDLIGNFGGTDLFISYSAGNGNDVALFTAVPEPASGSVIGLLMLALLVGRRRQDV